jgi:putative hydrolase of the HAD superfamily
MALVSNFDGIIFDYGGVLVRHQTAEDQAQLAQIAGIPVEIFTELYWADRLSYDKGDVNAAEYWREVAERAGAKAPDSGAIERLTYFDNESWMRFDPVMWRWLDELHAEGKRVAMLSNMPRDLGEALRSRTDRLNRFDQVTLSYEVRAVKPQAVIYERCLTGLNTAPERTLFLDDRIENVQGAEALGMSATQFLDRDDVLLQLRG